MSDCCNVPARESQIEAEGNLSEAHACCAPESSDSSHGINEEIIPLCPTNGAKGREVPMTAVASLVRWEVEAHRLVDPNYFLCRDSSCETVYFGSGRSIISKGDLRVRVGFKEKEGPIPLCYCFGVTEEDIRQEVLEMGKCPSQDRIVAEVKEGNCACHVKNPAGGCCLGDITKAIKRVPEESKSTVAS